MRILFVSHSYPPIVGGVESQNYYLAKGLAKLAQVTLIANSRGKKWLPLFFVWAFARGLIGMRRADACLLGNGVLGPLGLLLRLFHPDKRFFCVVHGLDVSYSSRSGLVPCVYKTINVPSLNTFDRLIMVGNATVDEAVGLGIEKERCIFIPNGVAIEDFRESHDRSELAVLLGEDLRGKRVILRLGRFVPHKGTSWFIENVMPQLSEDVVLVAAGHRVKGNTPGDRDDFASCEAAVANNHLGTRVRLLPGVSFEEVKILMNTVDLVVSPNIRMPGSMEGFGLNVLEACACGRVVVASRLEGLQDAINEGANGFLVEPGNVSEWTSAVHDLLHTDNELLKALGDQARQYVEDHFNWNDICREYVALMDSFRVRGDPR
jgi:glycosyltransferase involved in cell wall biosynthesis